MRVYRIIKVRKYEMLYSYSLTKVHSAHLRHFIFQNADAFTTTHVSTASARIYPSNSFLISLCNLQVWQILPFSFSAEHACLSIEQC